MCQNNFKTNWNLYVDEDEIPFNTLLLGCEYTPRGFLKEEYFLFIATHANDNTILFQEAYTGDERIVDAWMEFEKVPKRKER